MYTTRKPIQDKREVRPEVLRMLVDVRDVVTCPADFESIFSRVKFRK
jgi:hypothetical protein